MFSDFPVFFVKQLNGVSFSFLLLMDFLIHFRLQVFLVPQLFS